ncbi:flagellar biosynthesis protein FlhB [Bacillus sp. FJAT-27986]|uniref:flagellar biosynthesis protein FlhB n=1 Tax=Bacillus sp. FJAT-27986 TaxID=1743146 RepID=UPI00080AF95C|nr:flagellar biosynthesis protein FlhB [Bacillus sp. FJAT-27986]OCA89620.1 flagellar biosynthesis protein FlhB [Bacillus sp. FJAT-27986]
MSLLKLDLQFFSGEKTEKATPKKRQDARKKGQVAKSQDINTAVVLLGVFLILYIAGGFLKDRLLVIFKYPINLSATFSYSEADLYLMLIELLKQMAIILGPIMLAAFIAGIIANFAQVGAMFSTETIQFKLEKIDPIKGFKRIFSMRALVEMLKSILKITVIGVITFYSIWSRLDEIMMLSTKTMGASLITLADITVKTGLFASGALLFLALLDYLYQRFDFEKSIRMSKQEIKQEYKTIEGDPIIKSRIKQKQREMAMSRMMQEIPKADVVITNPTHYAIALKYDENQLDAPYVVGKGLDFVAQKIKLVAKENDIPMMENRPLARALYNQADIGQAIPEEFYKGVAEILAYVYKLKGKS